jgi:hypothetical protein
MMTWIYFGIAAALTLLFNVAYYFGSFDPDNKWHRAIGWVLAVIAFISLCLGVIEGGMHTGL